jgi:hypothetical protein
VWALTWGADWRTDTEEGEYSTYLTDEQRRDATQIRDFTTGGKPFGALDVVVDNASEVGD